MDENNAQETATEQAPSEPVLYAGKFDTVEKLENGYKESLSVHIKNKELEDRLNKMSAIPEQYNLPEDVKLDERTANDIMDLSKKASLTQQQFEAAARKKYSDNLDMVNKFEEKKVKLGSEKLNLLNTYINDNFGGVNESIRADLMTKLINDDSSMANVLADRESRLNSTIPGMDGHAVPAKKFDINEQIREASREAARNPGSPEKRARYIELCNQAAKLKEK